MSWGAIFSAPKSPPRELTLGDFRFGGWLSLIGAMSCGDWGSLAGRFLMVRVVGWPHDAVNGRVVSPSPVVR